MADRTLNIHVTGLPVFKEAVRAIQALHVPVDQEVESWADDEHPDEHDRRFPDCPGVLTDDGRGCEGHLYSIPVCQECGHEHDDGYPVYRSWPCPTILALAPLSGGSAD